MDFTLTYNLDDLVDGFRGLDFSKDDFELCIQTFRAMGGPRCIIRNSDNVVLIETEMGQVHD